MRTRAMEVGDAPAVAALCVQLGYPATAGEMERRMLLLRENADHGLFVVEDAGGGVVGWVHVCGEHLLVSPPYAEVGGLVVDDEARGVGVGRALMAEAERWARERGYREVRVRSGTARTGAHAFYQRIGYRLVKSQHRFVKTLE